MKQIITTMYKFSELSPEAQEKAIEELYDIDVSYAWWESIYEDAEGIGLKIKEFDIDSRSYCKGQFLEDAYYTANAIIDNHGETCETYTDATQFLLEWDKLVEKYSDGVNKDEVAEDNEYEFDQEADKLEEEFLKTLCEDYLSMLRKEYEYLTSEQAIKETIEANEYEFTEEGEII